MNAANRCRMWELDGEERAAQLGIRGELSEKETAELAGLRTGVGTHTDAKEKIRLVFKRIFIFKSGLCSMLSFESSAFSGANWSYFILR